MCYKIVKYDIKLVEKRNNPAATLHRYLKKLFFLLKTNKYSEKIGTNIVI